MEKETEDKILDAARTIFHKEGYAGARMQQIADEAGINKSMLHYYFRSKDKLFQKVFQEGINRFLPVIFDVLDSKLDLKDKIRELVEKYISFLKEKPQLPRFVIHEMNQNPDRFRKFIESKGMEIPKSFGLQVKKEIEAGNIRSINPQQLLINIIALCVFPLIAQNMIQTVFSISDNEFIAFLDERKKELPVFILKGLEVS